MTREEFIKQRCEIDKITEEEFERTYRVVECNCGKIYCKGYRCLDLDGLLKENQKLKKQLDENKHKGLYNTCLPYSTGYKKAIKEKENQQKEFINYLEDEINKLVKEYGNYVYDDYSEEKGKYDSYQEILQKYKEIIGDDKK